MGVRLVASDLDGTLLRAEPPISRRTIDAVRVVRAAGIDVVLVTGRPPRLVRSIARELGVDGLAICGNGAIIHDLDTDEPVHITAIEPPVLAEVIALLREAMPAAGLAWEANLELGCDRSFHASFSSERYPLPESMILDGETLPDGTTKVIVHQEGVHADELIGRVRAAVGERAVVTWAGGRVAEISAVGVHKAAALSAICEDRRIDASEVVAFGDAPNDVPMLEWAGRGVAVANAHPLAIQAANEVTASNEEDGVAMVLERLLA